MRIAISNLAWDFKRDDEILSLLKTKTVQGLEIAPAKIFGGPEYIFSEQTETIVKNYRQKCIKQFNLEIIAFQALLFGHPELKIFESPETRKATVEYLKKMITLSQKFGAKNLVLGSPKNRDMGTLSPQKAYTIAIDFFSELGDYAQKHQTHLCIEPNPKEYNCNFINTSKEGAQLVRDVANEGFLLHLDAGAMHMNKENAEQVIGENIDIISHFHISNPQLKGFEIFPVDHEKLGKILKQNNYQKWVSIEMLPEKNEIEGIKTALEIAQKFYQ